MKVGLVGYAGSGKSTVFEWLTGEKPDPSKVQQGQTAMADVPDERLAKIAAVIKPKKTTYTKAPPPIFPKPSACWSRWARCYVTSTVVEIIKNCWIRLAAEDHC